MARHKKRERRERVQRSPEQMLARVSVELTTLEALVSAYDNGHAGAAGAMATSILNILDAKSKEAIEARGKLVFPTPAGEISQANMLPTNRCVILRISTTDEGTLATFLPWCLAMEDEPSLQPFRIWWRTEPIYVEGIGGGGFSSGAIPIREEDQLTWDQREKVTRERFITDMRNSMGAHPDQWIPAVLDDLYQSSSFGGAPAVELPDGSIGTIENGAITMDIGPAEAMTRHIAEEVLMAYGRKPIGFWVGSRARD